MDNMIGGNNTAHSQFGVSGKSFETSLMIGPESNLEIIGQSERRSF